MLHYFLSLLYPDLILDWSKNMLSQNKGAAFVPSSDSSTCRLPPFSEEVIELTAYSDMWGTYTDNLICKVMCHSNSLCVLTIIKRIYSCIEKVVFFAGGKFCKIVGMTFHVAVIFTILLLFT